MSMRQYFDPSPARRAAIAQSQGRIDLALRSPAECYICGRGGTGRDFRSTPEGASICEWCLVEAMGADCLADLVDEAHTELARREARRSNA